MDFLLILVLLCVLMFTPVGTFVLGLIQMVAGAIGFGCALFVLMGFALVVYVLVTAFA